MFNGINDGHQKFLLCLKMSHEYDK
jgi:hypothetical protein